MELDQQNLLDIFTSLPDNEKEKKILLIKDKLGKSYELNSFIIKLPPYLRIKYLNLFAFNEFYNKADLISGISDDNIVYEILVNALNYTNLEIEIPNLFKLVPYQYKEQFLYEIKKKEELEQNEIITSYNVNDYLQEFHLEDRYHILKDILFKDFLYTYNSNKCRYTEYNYSLILKCFPQDKKEFKDSSMFKALQFLVEFTKEKPDEYNKNDHERIYNADNIINMIYENGFNVKEAIKYLIDSDVLSLNVGLSSVTEKLPYEIKKEVTIFIVEYYKQNNLNLGEYQFYSLIKYLNDDDLKELFNKYVLKEQLFDYSYVIGKKSFKTPNCLYYSDLLFDLLPEEQLEEYFKDINTLLITNPKLPIFEQGHESVIRTYSKKYKVSYEGLKLFIDKFGFLTLKYIDNENIQKLINMDSNHINKLFAIFNDNNYYFDKNIKNDILNSLIQRKFMLEQKNIYNIFGIFEKLISNQNIDGINMLLKKINNSIDINTILSKENITYNQFINQILNGNLDLLHKITNRFIAYQRELYLQEKIKNIDSSLNLDKIISKDEYKKQEMNQGYWHIDYSLKQLDKNKLTEEEKFLINNTDILKNLISFKNDQKNFPLSQEEKKYLKALNLLLEKLYEEKINFYLYDPTNEKNKNMKFDLIQKKVSLDFFLGTLIEAKYEGVICLLENDNLYQKLNDFFAKYKILGWQTTFIELMKECDINFGESTIASFFCNFDKFVDKIESKETLTSIIDYANCYSSLSHIYSLLFGREDYNYIAANSGKNKASLPKHKRLSGCVSLISNMYNKKYLTIPTIDKEFTISNGKKISINLGNFTNMMNLTYGERTNSCMRKGGEFNDLFEACLNNENCFHIRFTNPKTGKFVSRVSGVRNGNTIFLNELRNSVDSDYSDEDLYYFIKDVAKYLVDISKNSNVPIDNVIITSDYALSSHKKENQNFKLTIRELKEALYGLNFNLNNEAIILATSNQNQTLVDYKFGITLPKYDSLRDNISIYKGQNAKERIIQLQMINSLLNGLSIDEIDTYENIDEPPILISGEDYYIIVNDNKTEIYVLDKFQNNPQTIEEINNIINQYGLEKGSVKK